MVGAKRESSIGWGIRWGGAGVRAGCWMKAAERSSDAIVREGVVSPIPLRPAYRCGMQCNIDAKGKAVRLVSGLVTAAVGVTLLVLAGVGVLAGVWPWAVGAAALAGGAFQVYEGWCGWCVVRAMGWRTPI